MIDTNVRKSELLLGAARTGSADVWGVVTEELKKRGLLEQVGWNRDISCSGEGWGQVPPAKLLLCGTSPYGFSASSGTVVHVARARDSGIYRMVRRNLPWLHS